MPPSPSPRPSVAGTNRNATKIEVDGRNTAHVAHRAAQDLRPTRGEARRIGRLQFRGDDPLFVSRRQRPANAGRPDGTDRPMRHHASD